MSLPRQMLTDDSESSKNWKSSSLCFDSELNHYQMLSLHYSVLHWPLTDWATPLSLSLRWRWTWQKVSSCPQSTSMSVPTRKCLPLPLSTCLWVCYCTVVVLVLVRLRSALALYWIYCLFMEMYDDDRSMVLPAIAFVDVPVSMASCLWVVTCTDWASHWSVPASHWVCCLFMKTLCMSISVYLLSINILYRYMDI